MYSAGFPAAPSPGGGPTDVDVSRQDSSLTCHFGESKADVSRSLSIIIIGREGEERGFSNPIGDDFRNRTLICTI